MSVKKRWGNEWRSTQHAASIFVFCFPRQFFFLFKKFVMLMEFLINALS